MNGSAATIYDSSDWSDPPAKALTPPFQLHAGDQITWTCTYLNQTGDYLYFGESARNNEMCIFAAQFYPVPPNGQTMIECGTR